MQTALILLIVASLLIFMFSYRKASRLFTHSFKHNEQSWHAKPVHFGVYSAGRTLLLALFLLFAWWIFRDGFAHYITQHLVNVPQEGNIAFYFYEIKQALSEDNYESLSAMQMEWVGAYQRIIFVGNLVIMGCVFALAAYGALRSYHSINATFYARRYIEKWVKWALFGAAVFSIVITIMIFMSVALEAVLFFSKVSVFDFLFGLKWSPQTAIRADQAGASGVFGVVPLFLGTLLITTIALCVAVPIGLFSAIYMSQYASRSLRKTVKPMLEILAGIPTVVYGFFAITVMAPFLRNAGDVIGLDVASESALAAGLVMGIMIVPLVSSLADDAISSVPRALRDASLGLGATSSETIRQVILPAAFPGIMGGILLAVSRAIGETMIVVMAAGLAANLTFNPIESVTTITVQIVALLVGDQEFGSAKTLAAFALGMTLFIFTLILNVIALRLVKRYREAYE